FRTYFPPYCVKNFRNAQSITKIFALYDEKSARKSTRGQSPKKSPTKTNNNQLIYGGIKWLLQRKT
ncbi:MAG: hypothetical protein FWH20_10780, partial [Oscillospiraceae bacterium]|nr:hypothetical protein [Oscillospiraceae bacterium]